MEHSKLKKAVWGLHIVVAVLCILAIVSYFVIPFWSLKVSYRVQAETLDKMVGDSVDFDMEEVVGEDGVELNLSLAFKTGVLFKSYGNVDAAVDALIDDNVTKLVDQLTDTLNTLVETVVRAVTSDIVSQQVHDNVKDLLSEINPDITDAEVAQRLNDIGITDDFINSKTNAIIDKIYNGGSTVDDVCDEVVGTLDEIYAMMMASNDADLQTAELTQEDKDALRETMKGTIENFAAEDGTLDASELIASIFLQAIGSMKGSKSSAQSSRATSFATDEGQKESASDRLNTEIRAFLVEMIPSEVNGIVGWVMRGMTLLFFFSSFWWAYILLKLFIKALKHKKPKVQANPTMRLWTPVAFGWLPFFIFVLLPSLAFNALTKLLPAQVASVLSTAKVAFSSASIVAFVAAMVVFGIAIFNAVARKKLKKAMKSEEKGEDSEAVRKAAAAYSEYNAYKDAYNNGGYDNSAYGNDGQNGGYDNSYYNNGYYGNSQYDNSYYDNSYYDNTSNNSSSDDSQYRN